MLIAITGEGVTDYGDHPYGEQPVFGAAEGYADRIVKEVWEEPGASQTFEWKLIKRSEVERAQLGRSIKNLQRRDGKTLNAARFRLRADLYECDGAIYYCDADRDAGAKNSSRRQAEERYDEIYAQVRAGLDVSAKGNQHDPASIPMIPLRIIENWILGDSKNLRELYKLNDLGEELKDPEMLWGDKSRPESRYPKCIMQRIKERAQERVTKDVGYYDIGRNADPEVMLNTCRYSYGRFYHDFCAMLDAI